MDIVLFEIDNKYSLINVRLLEQCSKNQCFAQTGTKVEGSLDDKDEFVLFKLNYGETMFKPLDANNLSNSTGCHTKAS